MSPQSGQAGRAAGVAGEWPTALLQRVGERVERGLEGHPLATDLAIVLIVGALGLGGLWSQHRLTPTQALFTVALALPLLLRRRQPLAVLLGLALIAGVQWLIADPQLGDAALLVALYGVALRGSLLEVALAGAVMEVGAVLAAERWAPSDPGKIWIGLSGLVVAAAVLGVSVRQRRALVASLHEKAARLELERDREGRIAASAERNRIAREMHDIVAHNLSVMIALADGASYAVGSSAPSAERAIAKISATGRDALLEMRRLLGVLREDGDAQPLEPQPRIAELESIVEGVAAAGVPVELHVDGDPQALSAGVQLAVFRVAQEALTNTLKHTVRPTSACVRLRCDRDSVELDVLDTGPRAAAAKPARARYPRDARTRARLRRRAAGRTRAGRRLARAHARAPEPRSGEPGVAMSTRILLADDQELMRMGFRMVIESQEDLLVAGEAADGEQAVAAAAELAPDVVLMDVRMPGLDGIDATRRIVARDERVRIIVLTTFDVDEYAYAAIRAGASGFLLKDAPPAELLAAIRAVASGDAVIAPSVTRRLLARLVPAPEPAAPVPIVDERLALLTPREREVLIEVARGSSNAEIAARLVLAEATVKTHVGRILAKLALRDRVQIVVFAYENGLVQATRNGGGGA